MFVQEYQIINRNVIWVEYQRACSLTLHKLLEPGPVSPEEFFQVGRASFHSLLLRDHTFLRVDDEPIYKTGWRLVGLLELIIRDVAVRLIVIVDGPSLLYILYLVIIQEIVFNIIRRPQRLMLSHRRSLINHLIDTWLLLSI